LHGLLKRGVVLLEALGDVEAAVASGFELAGAVEVPEAVEAACAEDVIADLEATVTVFVGLELAPKRFSCGVVGRQEQADAFVVGSEPGVRAAVEEEPLALMVLASAPESVDLGASHGSAVSEGPEPLAQGLVAEADLVVRGEGIGQVGEVVGGILAGGQVDEASPQTVRGLVPGSAAGVAVPHAGGPLGPDLGLQTLDLASREAEGLRRFFTREAALDGRADRLVPLHLCQGQRHLPMRHPGSSAPTGPKSPSSSGVTYSRWC
jgi:hypothetical protein